MAKKKKAAASTTGDGVLWKVARDVQLAQLAHTLTRLSADGWTIEAILGPLSGGLVIVAKRFVVL